LRGEKNILFFIGLMVFGIGVFAIAGAYYNWDWFMKMTRHLNMLDIFSRSVSRILYAILGLILVILGVLAMLGLIK
jgi:uncharacterized membrane protein YidH (DUF202 family)